MSRPRIFSDEERVARRKAASFRYYEKNKSKIADWHKCNYQKRRDYILSRNKAWALKNPDMVRRLSLEGTNRRNARMKGCKGSHTHDEWLNLVKQVNGLCVCCHQSKKLSKDHIVPLICGGSDSIDNIQPLCRECNSSKRDRTINYLIQPKPAHVGFV